MEDDFKKNLKDMFPRVPVPESLQAKMLLRERAILNGKSAEEALNKNSYSIETQKSLMASAILGRLSMLTEFPIGSNLQDLVKEVQKMPSFSNYTKMPLKKQLEDLKNKEFLKILTESAPMVQKNAVKEKVYSGKNFGL